MKLDKSMQAYLKRKYFKGKGRGAQLLDLVFGRLLLFAGLFAFFWLIHAGLANSLIFSLTATIVLSLVVHMARRHRQEKFLQKEMQRVKNECALEKLTLLSREEFQDICLTVFKRHTKLRSFRRVLGGYYHVRRRLFCYAFGNHPENPVGVQQMLLLYRKLKKINAAGALILSAAPYVEEASAMSERLGVDIALLDKEAILRYAQVPSISVSEEEVVGAIRAEMSTQGMRDQLKQAFFAKSKQKAYLLCAALLILWSAATGFNLIYPIVAAICVFLAFYTYFNQKRREKKEHSA